MSDNYGGLSDEDTAKLGRLIQLHVDASDTLDQDYTRSLIVTSLTGHSSEAIRFYVAKLWPADPANGNREALRYRLVATLLQRSVPDSNPVEVRNEYLRSAELFT